ncbi:MAG: hypothetical protein V4514_19615 [Pseudomonadota bacterium]|uniref:hypothetical protein n=1 Tax=Phenylobacterium sp. TaxID=1871053 RepID=UPI0025FAEA74|nr:hypothetical protein [Phenylobacterium sp.]MBT9471987.1 hypothetical protein [Phenylobacterium sp.]
MPLDDKALSALLMTLASAIASLSRSIMAMQRGDSLSAKEQVEICVVLLANFQEAQERYASLRKPDQDV